MTVKGNPNNGNSGWDNIQEAMAAYPRRARRLDVHRIMTDDAYMIEMIGGEAVFDELVQQMAAVMGTALGTEETE